MLRTSSSVKTSPTATASSSPAVKPTPAVTAAIAKSAEELTRHSSRRALTSMSPNTATKTRAASVACGSRLRTGPRNSPTSSAETHVARARPPGSEPPRPC